ncbi:MAG: methylated-DNA--[protein]-cysteine S-methyltransferase [Ignavibacteriaceae bacterium]|nr:methylated-DNA--[protein]-cysteine S-methyltransferase [Ignavibacteriaceae bacterium]
MNEQVFSATAKIASINFTLFTTHKGILKLFFNDASHLRESASITQLQPDDPYLFGTFTQLREYFKVERKKFDLPLDLRGTEFQLQVWDQLQKIPYGKTVSYKQIAAALGDSNKVRAVGGANGANPVPIIVPCHRVINTNGGLGGYTGGIHLKEKLLKLEGKLSMGLFEF